ncbi:acyl-CoA thioesterase [Arthrobacter sp. E918]|uniref:Acyl-CoA thioesterase n=1 Tax=Arthrobacter mobilis TaxID=2724944 RepID=A0A7X6K7N5_9MICC|nr:acyl-CoA thioesterase [Arthrobacter mobilis]
MFFHRFRVRYHETDPQKFLFNSRYLEYADVAMTEFFRSLGWSYPELLQAGFDPSVVSSTLDFHRPAYLDDWVDAEVVCTRIGTSSFTLRFSFSTTGRPVCTVESVYVNVDPATASSRPIPAEIAHQIRLSQPALAEPTC